VALLIAGLAALTVAPPSALSLVMALVLIGAGAVAVPLMCQHVLFDISPMSIPMALALSSLAFALGLARRRSGGRRGPGAAVRVMAPPASLALALASCVPAVVAVTCRPLRKGAVACA
jgi:hypothetical protein